MGFNERPVLVFWETTRACALACLHCRASAVTRPLPGELTADDAYGLIDSVAGFGKPYPTLIFTGGDPLMRSGLFDFMKYAAGIGIPFAVSPAVTDRLNRDTLSRIRSAGASSISVSLDGSSPASHDGIRGVVGTFERTVGVIDAAHDIGLNLQVNTAIMAGNFMDLPEVFRLVRSHHVNVWELFFLVRTGRGTEVKDLSPEGWESVSNFVYDASHYGMLLRCVEGPFVRRILKERSMNMEGRVSAEYSWLKSKLVELEGPPGERSTLGLTGTLDGDGIIFVSHDGKVQPGGLLPVTIGDVRETPLSTIYRNDELLKKVRRREFSGECGTCAYRQVCGGSRARAYSRYGDPLASDPACIIVGQKSN